MGWRQAAVAAFGALGVTRVHGRWFGTDRLTVLAYHRVTDHRADDFVGFAGNVSAGPDAFAEQMQWAVRRHNPVSLVDVAGSLDGEPLPERPLLVTFDDGYRDNHDEALPIVREHSIPATVFLATDHIGSAAPFWWDRVAWACVTATRRPDELAPLGPVDWSEPQRVASRWIESVKPLPTERRLAAIDALEHALEAEDHGSSFDDMHLTWDQVRAMRAHAIDFGAHTCSHPILTRLDPDEADREVEQSVRRVERETEGPVLGFAYPNGLAGDFDDRTSAAVERAGVPLGFSLLPGPARRSEVDLNPLRIRRVYVHHRDTVAAFGANIAGFPRLWR